MITIAQWDTEHFGFKVGNLTFDGDITQESINQARIEAKAKGYDLLYIKGVNIPEKYIDEKLKLVDEKVIYAQSKLDSFEFATCAVSALKKPLSDDLLQLAYESGKYSRYILDEKLPSSVFPTLYRLWMEKSLSGEIADDVLVIQKDGKQVGMLTYKIENNVYEIGLVAVSPKYAGNGVGTSLMQSFLSIVEKSSEIEVATQKHNSVACHYYEKNGFKVKSITNIYHLWIK